VQGRERGEENMRVAVVGLGWWGMQLIRSLDGSARLEAICAVEPNPSEAARVFARERRIGFETDLAKVLVRPEIEGIILATPHALHEEQCLAVLAAGKNLFCEKPLAMTGRGARRILDQCARKGKILGIGHERRYEPAFEEVGRMISSGKLGRILAFDANVSHDLLLPMGAENWRHQKSHAPAGLMTGVGVHLTDLFIAYAGPIVEVRAATASLVSDPDLTDFMTASMRFASGARGSITTLSCTPFYGRFTLFADHGWVEVTSEGNVDKACPTVLTLCEATGAERKTVVYDPVDAVRLNLEAWAAAVVEGSDYRFTSAQLLNNIEVLEAIVTSADRGGAAVRLHDAALVA
jgi:predicted dehydrogenase